MRTLMREMQRAISEGSRRWKSSNCCHAALCRAIFTPVGCDNGNDWLGTGGEERDWRESRKGSQDERRRCDEGEWLVRLRRPSDEACDSAVEHGVRLHQVRLCGLSSQKVFVCVDGVHVHVSLN